MSNITINTTPPQIALAGNGLVYNITTANAKSAAGSLAKFAVTFAAAWDEIAENDTFTLTCDLFTIDFVFKDSPDESGTQLPTPTDSTYVTDYSPLLRDAMLKNYYIATYCELSQLPANVNFNFEFRNKGSFSLAVDAHWGTENTPLTVTPTDGTNETYRSNYRLCALIENSLNDQLIVIEKFPFPALSIDFDIADFIKHLCSSDFTMNPDALLFEHSSAIVSYVTKFFDKYGSPPVPSILYPDTTRYALPGGIDKNGLAAYAADETDVMTQFIADKRFLTHADDEITLKFDDVIRLYFLLNTSNNVQFRWARYTVEGYILGSWQFNTQDTYDPNTIVECVCDPLKLFSEANLEAAHYIEVKLYDNTAHADLSETRRYYLDNNISTQRLQFVFANSFEIAYDTIFAYGKAEHNFDIENYTLLYINDAKSQSRSYRTDKFIVRSGYLTFRQLFYWQEFIQSNQRYLIRDGRRIPCRILSTNIFMYKNQVYNFGIELEIELDDRDKFRSTLPDQAIAFSDYFNSYGFSFAVSAAIAGHIILDADGNEMPQRNKLQFTGHNVQVSDNEAGDKTVINIAHTGVWFDVMVPMVAEPTSTSTIDTIVDVRDSIKIGNIIAVTQDGTTRELVVSNVTWDDVNLIGQITTSTAELITSEVITAMKVKSLSGPTISSKDVSLASGSWSGSNTQTITVEGVGYISLVIVSPAGSDFTNYENFATAQIIGTTQGNNQVVVKCKNIPTSNISVKITYIWH